MKNGALYSAKDAPRGSFGYMLYNERPVFGLLFGPNEVGDATRLLVIENGNFQARAISSVVYVVPGIKIIVDPLSLREGYNAPPTSILANGSKHLIYIGSNDGIDISTGEIEKVNRDWYYFFTSWTVVGESHPNESTIVGISIDTPKGAWNNK